MIIKLSNLFALNVSTDNNLNVSTSNTLVKDPGEINRCLINLHESCIACGTRPEVWTLEIIDGGSPRTLNNNNIPSEYFKKQLPTITAEADRERLTIESLFTIILPFICRDVIKKKKRFWHLPFVFFWHQ